MPKQFLSLFPVNISSTGKDYSWLQPTDAKSQEEMAQVAAENEQNRKEQMVEGEMSASCVLLSFLILTS